MANEKKNMKQIVAAVERGEGEAKKTYWMKLGVGFENKDGSMNLKFDTFPTDPRTTIQLRDFDPKTE